MLMAAVTLLSWRAPRGTQHLSRHLCHTPISSAPTPGLLVLPPAWASSLATPGAWCRPAHTPQSCPLTDRPGVTQRAEVDQLQEDMALALQSYLKGQRRGPGTGTGAGRCPREGRGEGDTEPGMGAFTVLSFRNPDPLGGRPPPRSQRPNRSYRRFISLFQVFIQYRCRVVAHGLCLYHSVPERDDIRTSPSNFPRQHSVSRVLFFPGPFSSPSGRSRRSRSP